MPAEYDLNVEFTPTDVSGFTVGFSHGNRSCGWTAAPRHGVQCFQLISGAGPDADANAAPGKLHLEDGRRYSVVVRVRNNELAAFVDGKLMDRHATNGRDLIGPPEWAPFDAGRIGVGKLSGGFVVHKVRIVEISGRGRPVPPLPEDPRQVHTWATGGAVGELAFTPDGRSVLSNSSPHVGPAPELRDVETGRATRDIGSAAGAIRAFAPDGRLVVRPANGSGAAVYEFGSSKLVASVPSGLSKPSEWLPQAAFSPDSTRVAIGFDGSLQLWELTGGKPRRLGAHDKLLPNSLGFSPDGDRLVSTHYSVGGDKAIYLWDARNLTEVWTVDAPVANCEHAEFSPDGKHILAANWHKGVLLDVTTAQAVMSYGGDERFVSVKPQFSPDGRQVMLHWRGGGPVAVYDTASGATVRQFGRPLPNAQRAVWMPGGKRVLAGYRDGTLRVLDVESGEAVTTLTSPSGPVTTVAASPDGRHVASGHRDGAVRVFRLPGGPDAAATIVPKASARLSKNP